MNVVLWIVGAIVALRLIGGIFRHKRGRNKVIRVVESNCTGCRRCLRRCRHRVLDTINDAKGAHVFVKNPNYCTACGDCVSVCKFNALELVTKN
jgi:NAD-dependent dihydropyrimidine dehydrogenase PreA subunit